MNIDNHFEKQFCKTIKEGYSGVSKIKLFFRYHDNDNMVKDSDKEIVIIPESTAFFKFDCPYRECIDGGFDLTIEVTDMLKSHKNIISGQKICNGWQDKERINIHHCLCKLTYKIEAYYKN